MKLTTIKTINGLEIKARDRQGDTHVPKWTVWSPDGRLLEEFRRYSRAVAWAKRTTDFKPATALRADKTPW